MFKVKGRCIITKEYEKLKNQQDLKNADVYRSEYFTETIYIIIKNDLFE